MVPFLSWAPSSEKLDLPQAKYIFLFRVPVSVYLMRYLVVSCLTFYVHIVAEMRSRHVVDVRSKVCVCVCVCVCVLIKYFRHKGIIHLFPMSMLQKPNPNKTNKNKQSKKCSVMLVGIMY